ncbi:MAG TPA: radical SAM protein [Euryarchaeota archaeon]|nr:radical SAM protein [Euryarchaeota archaeon]
MIIVQKSALPKGLPKKTTSLCPVCKKIIPATIYEENGKVMYKKTCPEHGEFKDIYFGDVESYLRLERWSVDGIGVNNPNTETRKGHPFDCGLCPYHLSHTALANLDLTNRCNLKCPICFANANAAGYVYEPTLDEVKKMLKMLRDEQPVPTPAVQFAGGEPTIYPHFLEAVKAASEMGFAQVQVATNGIRLAYDPSFAQAMVDAGMHTVYLQFDGFKEETYIKARGRRDMLKIKLLAIEHCKRTKPKPLATVLVPVIVRGINDDEVGKIVDFALENMEVIRSVNFQPVSFSGRINQEQRLKGRYTIGDLINDLADQTDYIEGPEDFFPIPAAAVLSELISQIANEPKVAFTTHPHCGSAAYLFREDGGRVISLTRFIDADGLLDEAQTLIESGEFENYGKLRGALKAYQLVKRHIDTSKAPKGLNVLSMLKSVFLTQNKKALGEFHWRTLFIGAMHFQDLYNYDLERVRRCVIHYTTPDGRIIPFCAYNTGPEFRVEVEKKFGMSIEVWQKRNPGRDIMGRDLYPSELPA